LDRKRRPLEKVSGAPKELGKRDSASCARQIDGPRVVQRNAREKCVDAERKPFVLLASDLRHNGYGVRRPCPFA